MMELRSETDYAKHHAIKIQAFFAAMRSFANHFSQNGFNFIYLKLDDTENQQDFAKNINALIAKHQIEKLEILEPDEYRLDEYFKQFSKKLQIPYQCFSTEHFMAKRNELEMMFGQKDRYLMENFYRRMRAQHNVLMDGKKPVNGKWNFDTENRKKLPNKHPVPQALLFQNDVRDIKKMLINCDIEHLGAYQNTIGYPITRNQALEQLDYFCENLLLHFGDYQDAMSDQEEYIYHSRLSFALNTKILSPKEVIDAAITSFEKNKDMISYAQLEGFVRQILGWREFMRCFYWTFMPGFAYENFFNNETKLPQFYWNANTKMNCMHHCIKNSLDNAYAHHIQRLMVTGNFALLAGVDPSEVDQWYLGIYIDAIEWVEITNTRGMSQWSDGGGLATKPYVSSANYINKMSNYCKSCHYDHKLKYGKKACPFNSLYWAFLDKHQEKLSNNQRMSMIYRVWAKMDTLEQEKILEQAQEYLKELDAL